MTRDEIENLFTPELEKAGYELVDLKLSSQNGKMLVQVFIDHKEAASYNSNVSITFDDCEKVSDILGKSLEASAPDLDGYLLEVSSPGIDRLLKKEKDFNRFIGSPIKIKLKQPLEGTKIFYGDIVSCKDGVLYLSEDTNFKLEDIAEARLHYSDEDILKKK